LSCEVLVLRRFPLLALSKREDQMRAWFVSTHVVLIALAFGSTTAQAQSVMKKCGDQWEAAKAAGRLRRRNLCRLFERSFCFKSLSVAL
jgi:hypothetical protein